MTNSQWKKYEAEKHNKAYEESKKRKPAVKRVKSNKRAATLLTTGAGIAINSGY